MRRRYFIFRKSTLTVLLIVLVVSNTGFTEKYLLKRSVEINDSTDLYDELGLAKLGLARDPFSRALQGMKRLKDKGTVSAGEVISIADFSKPSSEKRLYVIDLAKKNVMFHTYVSHGRNTGAEYARSFANDNGSFKSSLGFFSTGSTYKGEHGTSLRLLGLEPGINDKALERGSVIHGASYVSEQFIARNGRLGRSHGCPAVPEHLCGPIIDQIKGGSCFYIYYPDSAYFSHSRLLH